LGCIMPNAMALAGEYSPRRIRVTLMMIVSCGFTLGGVVGGWLLKHDGASTVFYTCSGLVFCWLICAAFMKAPVKRT
ncbi:MFS transporter, partial [Burkholderia sp. SIMBA_019]|uniref:MFS transporter n=1 Tax=Burkholderia sp. SIMBA_019 TaxID=3085765 RepID=UPI00397E82D1